MLSIDEASTLHSRRASRKAISSLGAVMLSGVLCSNAVAATPVTEIYKTYTHIKINSHKEYICIEKLWTKESNWNPNSNNKKSTAYGIPQLLNMKERDPYKQIDLGLKYLDKRYNGSACNAWAFFKVKGYY